jgi:hypothetical protein
LARASLRYKRVPEQGTILSEFPMGAHPTGKLSGTEADYCGNGNRSVEEKQYSGWLITARPAVEFAGEVCGVPRNVTQVTSVVPSQFDQARCEAGEER